MAAVEISNLSKTFRDFFGRRRVHALDGLSLSVKAGEVFGLLGPNGSGKSTTFKIAVGLLRPSDGRVSINGKAPGTLAARRATGFLPEDSTLLPFLSALETLKLHGSLAGLSRTDDDSFLRLALRNFVAERHDSILETKPTTTGLATYAFTTSSLAHIDHAGLLQLEVIGDLSPGATAELRVDYLKVEMWLRDRTP